MYSYQEQFRTLIWFGKQYLIGLINTIITFWLSPLENFEQDTV